MTLSTPNSIRWNAQVELDLQVETRQFQKTQLTGRWNKIVHCYQL